MEIPTCLKTLPLFAEFTDTELDALMELLEPVEVKAGERIVRQDEPGDTMFIILQGAARVIHRTNGDSVLLARLGEGDFFGELALVDQLPRSADVVVTTDATLLCISQAAIRAFAGVSPGAAFKLLIAIGRVLVERLRRGNLRYIDSLLAKPSPNPPDSVS